MTFHGVQGGLGGRENRAIDTLTKCLPSRSIALVAMS